MITEDEFKLRLSFVIWRFSDLWKYKKRHRKYFINIFLCLL